jgi:2-haloacid dehalogenase
VDRWATFDCYGTLIDWNAGIAAAMTTVWPDGDGGRLLARYHAVEPLIEEGCSLPYRAVMDRALAAVAAIEGLELADGEREAISRSLPSWTPFPEVPGALAELRDRGWRLAILSNSDPDLLATSIARLGVDIDLAITADVAGSYKPAPGHWRRFRELAQPAPGRHVHVAASAFHDLEGAAPFGIPAVWINRLGESSDAPRAAELSDLAALPGTLEAVVPAG